MFLRSLFTSRIILIGVLLFTNITILQANEVVSEKKELENVLNGYANAYLFGDIKRYNELVHGDRFGIGSSGNYLTNDYFTNNARRMKNSEFVRYKETKIKIESVRLSKKKVVAIVDSVWFSRGYDIEADSEFSTTWNVIFVLRKEESSWRIIGSIGM
ncbi:MAG: nuclear transport factor 2 family protein [Gammaproteobacteria bacterium]|nr:nuclear transport factor 2 family protein [Gammaproteobacteria bacterium]